MEKLISKVQVIWSILFGMDRFVVLSLDEQNFRNLRKQAEGKPVVAAVGMQVVGLPLPIAALLMHIAEDDIFTKLGSKPGDSIHIEKA